jgi:hypothetical protein
MGLVSLELLGNSADYTPHMILELGFKHLSGGWGWGMGWREVICKSNAKKFLPWSSLGQQQHKHEILLMYILGRFAYVYC